MKFIVNFFFIKINEKKNNKKILFFCKKSFKSFLSKLNY